MAPHPRTPYSTHNSTLFCCVERKSCCNFSPESASAVFLINSVQLPPGLCISAQYNQLSGIRVNSTLTSKYDISFWWVFECTKALSNVLLEIGPGFFRSLLLCIRFTFTFLHQLLDFSKVKTLGLGPQHNHWHFTELSFKRTY